MQGGCQMQNPHPGADAYPLGLPGVISYGTEKWVREYVPLDDGGLFQSVHEAIFDAYAESLGECPPDSAAYWCAVARCKIVPVLANQYYKLATLRRIKSLGFSSVFFDEKEDIDRFFSSLSRSCRPCPPAQLSLKLKMIEFARFARWNGSLRGCIKCLFGRIGASHCLLGDPSQPEVRSYLEKHGIRPLVLRPDLLRTGKWGDQDAKEISEAAGFVERLFEKMASRICDAGLFFADGVVGAYGSVFRSDAHDFLHMRKIFSNGANGILLLSSVHHERSRLVAAAWKSAGLEVVGFGHGNSFLMGIRGQPLNNGTLLVCDKYIVSSEGERMQLERARAENPSRICAATEIINEAPPPESNTFIKAASQESSRANIRTVMVVGFPMDYLCYAHLRGCSTLSYAHLTANLISSLKKGGYRVVYKAHPDTSANTNAFFEAYADEVLVEDFTLAYRKADCLLYMTPYSTTFGVGVSSRLPVIYVDNRNWSLWHPDIKRLLDKRAVPLAVHADESGRFSFDEAALLEGVRSSAGLDDYEVVLKYAC